MDSTGTKHTFAFCSSSSRLFASAASASFSRLDFRTVLDVNWVSLFWSRGLLCGRIFGCSSFCERVAHGNMTNSDLKSWTVVIVVVVEHSELFDPVRGWHSEPKTWATFKLDQACTNKSQLSAGLALTNNSHHLRPPLERPTLALCTIASRALGTSVQCPRALWTILSWLCLIQSTTTSPEHRYFLQHIHSPLHSYQSSLPSLPWRRHPKTTRQTRLSRSSTKRSPTRSAKVIPPRLTRLRLPSLP